MRAPTCGLAKRAKLGHATVAALAMVGQSSHAAMLAHMGGTAAALAVAGLCFIAAMCGLSK